MVAVNHAIQLRLSADGSSFVGEIRVARDELTKLEAAAHKTSAAMNGLPAGQMAAAAQGAAQMGAATAVAGTASASAAASIRAMGVGAGVAAVGLIGVGVAGARFAAEAAKTAEAAAAMDRRLAALTGTGAALAETKAWLAESADRLGKSLPALADGYARLNPMMRSGLLTTAQARDLTLGLIDAQVAFGASADSMGNVLYGLSQALSSPIVRMEELNQVVEPLPGLLADLDKAAGLPAGGFRALVAAGKATDAVFRDSLIKALKGYEGTAAQAATGFEGSTARMAEAWRQLQIRIGNAATPGLTNSANAGTAALNLITRQFDALTQYNAEGDLARLRLWAQELAKKRDAALTSLFRVSDGVWADKNLQAAFAAALSKVDQEIADTEAAIIDLEKRLGQADRSLTGVLNAAAGKTGAQAGTARTAADALRGAWVAAAEAAGLQTDAIGRLTTPMDELARHTAALAKVAALPPEELRKLGISAGDVTRAAERLRQALDPATAAIKALNDETMRINAGKFAGLADAMAAARPMQGRPTSDDQGTADIANAWRRKRAAASDEIIQQLEDEAKATKALAEAQASGNPLEIAFAKAKSDTTKAIKDGLDPAKEELYYEQALSRELAALAGSQGAAATAYDQAADVRVLAAKRLAEAQAQGAEAVREAEIVNRAAAQAESERVALDSARGQAILAKVRAEEKWKQAASESTALKAANDNLSDLRAEIALHGQSAAVRERAVRSIQIQRQAVEQFGTATSAAARQWIALQEEIADAQAIQRFREEVDRVAEDIAGDLATAMFEGFAGSETDILDWFKGLLKRMAIEIVKQQFILPVTTQIVSAVPGLFGVSGPVTGAQAAAAVAGQGGGGLGSASDWLGLGSKFIPSNWTSGIVGAIDTWGATTLGIGSAAAMPTTILTGANGMLAGGGATSIVPGQVAAGTGLTSYLGPLGIGAAAGSLLPGLVGAGSRGVAALVGAGGGAAAGALAGTFLFPGVGTALGALLGGAGGGLSGLLGFSKKKTPGAGASGGIDSLGNIVEVDQRAVNGANADSVTAIRDGTLSVLAALKSAGAELAEMKINVGWDQKTGYTTRINGADKPVISDNQQPEIVAREVVAALMSSGDLTFSDRRLATAAAAPYADLEEFFNHIALAKKISDGATALAELDVSLAGVAEAARKASAETYDAIREEASAAAKIGLGADYKDLIKGEMQVLIDQMVNPASWTALETALATLEGQAAAAADASRDLGLGLEAAITAAAAQAKAQLADQGLRELTRGTREASGRGYLNNLNDEIDALAVGMRQSRALGIDPAAAVDQFTARVQAAISGLSETQLDEIIHEFGASSADAARAIVAAATAIRGAAAATAAAAARDDLSARAMGTTSAGQAILDVRKIIAQGKADSLIDPTAAADVARAALTRVAGGLDAAGIRTLMAEFDVASVDGRGQFPMVMAALSDALSNVAGAGAIAATRAAALAQAEAGLVQARQAAQGQYLSALTAQAQGYRQAASAARSLSAALSALPDRLALDADLSTLDPAGRLDEAWRQLGVELSKAVDGASADLLTRVRAGDGAAAVELDRLLAAGKVDPQAAAKIEGLIEATLQAGRGYYADLSAYGGEYAILTGLADGLADAAGEAAKSYDASASAADKTIVALGGTTTAANDLTGGLGSTNAALAALATAAQTAAATWRGYQSQDFGDASVAESNRLIAAAAAASGHGYSGAFRNDGFGNFAFDRLGSLGAGSWDQSGGRISAMLRAVTGYGGAFENDAFTAFAKAGGLSEIQKQAAREILTRNGLVPKFAAGGDHVGGLRLVGELGPELEATGAARVHNAAQTQQILRGAMTPDMGPVVTAISAGASATVRAIDASAGRIVGAVDGLSGEIARLNRVIADQGREIARLTAIVGRLAA